MSGRSDYETKLAARIERLRELAAKRRAEGEARLAAARERASYIPLGQPILVGHHSEARHRRDLERIHQGHVKGYEALDAAKYHEKRARAAESNRAISSDNPDAIELLRVKLAKIEADRERSRQINKAVRSKDPRASLRSLGESESMIDKLLTRDFAGRLGVPDYMLTNWSAEARRIKERIAMLEKADATPPREDEHVGEVRIHEGENRVQIIFPGKPSDTIRSELKGAGFRWSPTEGAWQRMASEQAWYHARRIAGRAEEERTP